MIVWVARVGLNHYVASRSNLSEKTLTIWVSRVGLNPYVLNSHLVHVILLRFWAAGTFSNVSERLLTADDVHEFEHALRRCKNQIEIEIMVTLDLFFKNELLLGLSLHLHVGGWLSERASQEVGPLSCRWLRSRSRRRRFRPRRLVRRKR